MSRRLKLFFTMSVLLNILLIGTMAGFVAKCHYHRGPDMSKMAKLSPAGRALMADTFTKSHDQMGDVFDKARAARDDVMTVLEADTFDKAAFEKASDRLRQLQFKIIRRRADTAGDLAAKLDPADRKLLAEWLAGPGGHHTPSKYFPHEDKNGATPSAPDDGGK